MSVNVPQMIELTVNSRRIEVAAETSIAQLIERLGMRAGPIAVELNERLIPAADHPRTIVVDGDSLEIVTLAGGG
jgi:thiamine biosynthesis protein ThiS